MSQNSEASYERIMAGLEEVVELLSRSKSKRFVERAREIGLDPMVDLAGGDWRFCDFSKNDLAGCDFRNARLFGSNFQHSTLEGCDFRGATDVHTAKIHLAYNWREAIFEPHQYALVEAQEKRLQSSLQRQKDERDPDRKEVDWFRIIRSCSNFDEARILLDEMEEDGFPLNRFAYSYVLDRAKRSFKFKDGWDLYQTYREGGGELDEVLLTAAIGVAPDGEIAIELFNEIKRNLVPAGLWPGEKAYNAVIAKQTSFAVALAIFHEMSRRKIPVTRYSIFSLFDTTENFANAITVLMEATKHEVDIDDDEFLGELLQKSRYFQINEWNVQVWREQGHSPREIIRRLIWATHSDPFRSEALSTLKFPTNKPQG